MTERSPPIATPPAPPAAAEAWLVTAAQFGDRRALDALLRGVQAPLFRHLAWLTGSDDAAADVLQDVLLTISRTLGGLRDPRWFRAWAFRIATRRALRSRRRGRGAPDLVALADAGELVVDDPPPRPFDDDEVAAALAALALVPPASQLVLRMHYESGLTLVEVAEALGISVGTVKSRHHYGLQWLRRRLGAAAGQA